MKFHIVKTIYGSIIIYLCGYKEHYYGVRKKFRDGSQDGLCQTCLKIADKTKRD